MTENWNRKTWALAGPIMISNVSVPLLGAVDTAVMGRLPGPQYLGAVAIGALIFSFAYAGFNFLRMGTTGLTAQSYGARDADQIRAWLARALALAVASGVVLIALQQAIIWISLLLIDPSDQVRPLTESYFHIRIWSAPATLANFAILGWFFGVQNTRAALITQVAMNGANIVLDIWFVIGLGWGIEGVAWATLISEVSAVALGLWLVQRELRRLGGRWDMKRAMNPDRLRLMMRVNSDIFIRSVFLQAAFFAFTAVGARMGDLVLAANALLMNLVIFGAYALDGFANAVEALAGEALGAGERRQFRAAVVATGRWALIFAVILAAVFMVVGDLIIDVLSAVPEVRSLSRDYLLWSALLPLVGVWSFQLDGIFIGSTRTAEMRNGMIISMAVFAAAVAVLVPLWGNHGLWLAMWIFMAVRAVTLGLWYPRLERSVGTD